tara:strand:+ start:4136 stop:4315 length:180 start_codon:yes stop_codon:yes gene_type:complete
MVTNTVAAQIPSPFQGNFPNRCVHQWAGKHCVAALAQQQKWLAFLPGASKSQQIGLTAQ